MAGSRPTLPAARPKASSDLFGHQAGISHHVSPPIAERLVPGQGVGVVTSGIAETVPVECPPIEFHDHPVRGVDDIGESSTELHLAAAGRQLVDRFDVTGVVLFQH